MIQKLTTNLKGKKDVEFESNKIYLVGSNGSGKTSIINAIELALTGEIHEFGGRKSAKASYMLKELVGAGPVIAKVTTDNGTYSNPHNPCTSIMFPMAEVEKSLIGSADTFIKFVATYLLTDKDIVAELVHPYTNLVQSEGRLDQVLEVLALATNFKKTHDAKAKELKKASDTIEHVVEPHVVQQIQLQVKQAERRSEGAAKVLDDVTSLLKMSVESALPRIGNIVNKYLLNNEVGVHITGSRCFIGFWREGRVHPAVSGAEWVSLVAAWCGAVAESVEEDCVLVLGDYMVTRFEGKREPLKT